MKFEVDTNEKIRYKTKIDEIFTVSEIITVYYYEFMQNYTQPIEVYDFWQIHYVARGERHIEIDSKVYHLEAGQAIFCPPNVPHKTLLSDNPNRNDMCICSFTCNSAYMDSFKDKIFDLNDDEQKTFLDLVYMGINIFENANSDEYEGLKAKDDIPITSMQTIKIYLELFLITLYNRENNLVQPYSLIKSNLQNRDSEIVSDIKDFLADHLHEDVTVDDVAKHIGLSSTAVKTLFKSATKYTIIEYFSNMKVDKAKVLIKTTSLNFTEISEMLGFSSVYYFSSFFKKKTGLTPSDYSKSKSASLVIHSGRSFPKKG